MKTIAEMREDYLTRKSAERKKRNIKDKEGTKLIAKKKIRGEPLERGRVAMERRRNEWLDRKSQEN